MLARERHLFDDIAGISSKSHGTAYWVVAYASCVGKLLTAKGAKDFAKCAKKCKLHAEVMSLPLANLKIIPAPRCESITLETILFEVLA
jgi:hypothetical protein